MAYVDAATYQILGNLKIVTTGFLFWIALKRYLSRIQVSPFGIQSTLPIYY